MKKWWKKIYSISVFIPKIFTFCFRFYFSFSFLFMIIKKLEISYKKIIFVRHKKHKKKKMMKMMKKNAIRVESFFCFYWHLYLLICWTFLSLMLQYQKLNFVYMMMKRNNNNNFLPIVMMMMMMMIISKNHWNPCYSQYKNILLFFICLSSCRRY